MGKKEVGESWRRRCDDGSRSLSDSIAGMGPQAKECRQPLKARKGKKEILP